MSARKQCDARPRHGAKAHLVVHDEPERNQGRDDLERKLEVVRRDLPPHVPVLIPPHPVVHGELYEGHDQRRARQGRRRPLQVAQGPEQHEVHEAHGELVAVLDLVAEYLVVLVVKRDEEGGHGRRDDVEEQDHAQGQGVVVDVRYGLGGVNEGRALGHNERERPPEFEEVESAQRKSICQCS